MEFDDGDPEPEVEGIPLADDDAAKPRQAQGQPQGRGSHGRLAPTGEQASASRRRSDGKEDDAIAQFLLDLKLDDE